MGYQNSQSLRKEQRTERDVDREKMGKCNKGITHGKTRIGRDERKGKETKDRENRRAR